MSIDLDEACIIAVKEQSRYFKNDSRRMKIRRILESVEYFVVDFSYGHNMTVYGGGGYLINRETKEILQYCMPSFPKNIFSIMDKCKNVEIPDKYR